MHRYRADQVRFSSTIGAIAALVAGSFALPAGAAAAAAPSTGTVVGTAPSPVGQVLVVGSGSHAGYALYLLTSDAPPKFGCTTTVVQLAPGVSFPCAGPEDSKTADWPALTTVGPPVAGPGVSRSLLGTVKRSDLGADQVTYAGHPLYLFDPSPAQFTGENVDTPTVPPDHGVWYLVSPKRGRPALPVITLSTATLQGGRIVLGAGMNIETPVGPTATSLPVYTYSRDSKGRSTCVGPCAIQFPPLLTAKSPQVAASSNLKQRAVGVIRRADGTLQVTYNGHPLYLFGGENMNAASPSAPLAGTGNGVKASGRSAGSFSLVSSL